MKLSTRSRYGVRFMLALAEHSGSNPVFLKDIAREEAISEKYLSLIVIPLRRAGLVESIRGAHGGYVLAKKPHEITICHIVDLLESGNGIVDCLKKPWSCPRASACPSRHVWVVLDEKIRETLHAVTLHDLMETGPGKFPSPPLAERQGIIEKGILS